MFDLGNGDKEKLEENMEEIKQLVNEGQDQENPVENNTEQLKQAEEENQNSPEPEQIKDDQSQQEKSEQETEDDSDQNSDVEELAQDLSQQQMDDNPIEGNQLDQEFDEMQQEIKDEISSLKQTQSTHQQQRNHKQNKTPQSEENITQDKTGQSQAQENSEAPGELEEPDLHTRGFEEDEEEEDTNEGPLFLEVDNFEDMKEMIEEMHYLTAEMDDIMQHLQAGIEEDQNTMNEAEKVIQEFQTRRDKVNETLKNN